jgi:hypothetical protein
MVSSSAPRPGDSPHSRGQVTTWPHQARSSRLGQGGPSGDCSPGGKSRSVIVRSHLRCRVRPSLGWCACHRVSLRVPPRGPCRPGAARQHDTRDTHWHAWRGKGAPSSPVARRQLLDPTLRAASGYGTDGSITAHDEDDVREDFWTAEVYGWWSRCGSCGCLHYLPAPETRALVAAAAARGEPFVRLAPLSVRQPSSRPRRRPRARPR